MGRGKDKESGAEDLSDEAQELLRAYFRTQERFDLQFSVGAYPNYTGEEVIVVKTEPEENPRYILLPERERALQADMNAKGASGRKLVILTRSFLEGVYSEIFTIAFRRIQGSELDLSLLKSIVSVNEVSQIFNHGWVKSQAGVGENRTAFFHDANEIIESLNTSPGELDPADACVLVFVQYLGFLLEDAYQPCVDLGPDNPYGSDGSVANRVLIKYSTNRTFLFDKNEHIRELLLGYYNLELEIPHASTGSSHFRLRAPMGLVFTAPMQISKMTSRPEINRDQIQLYHNSQKIQEVSGGDSPSPFRRERTRLHVRLNQTIGSRLLLLTAYSLVTLFPPIVAWIEMRSIGVDEVELTGVFLLPVVVALVAASWSHAHLRTFAVTQLMILIFLLGGWILAQNFLTVMIVVLLLGNFFMILNIVETLKFPFGLSYSQFASTRRES